MSLSPSRQPTYRLRAVTGPAQGERYPIVDHVTFGSDEGNSVRLHDTLVSPAHARVAQQGGHQLRRDRAR